MRNETGNAHAIGLCAAYGSSKLGMRWQKMVTVPKKLFQGLCRFSSMDASRDRQENV